jgi:hypothetical protein
MIIQALKQSHPIMTRVIPSIWTGSNATEMIAATAKLTISL